MIPKQLKNLKFCRIRYKTKKPFEKDWVNKPYTYQEISKFKDKNYGVLCGYENLAVIDCDDFDFYKNIKEVLPKTYSVKTGGGGIHLYYFIPELKQKIILDLDNKHLGEVQSKGTQVVGPGSTHPKGTVYKEINQEKIATLNCEELLSLLKPFMKKEIQQTEEHIKWERTVSSNEIDNLSVANIWGLAGLKEHNGEYYGSHPIHGSDGGMNFWINPLKNMWHCFRCNSGGGVLSAIAVKEGIINCSEARAGSLRGSKALESINKAKEKYGLTTTPIETTQEQPTEETPIIWEYELQDYVDEEKEWIIDRLIPTKSVCILTGKRGTLKTFVTLSMAYAIASGNKFLGEFSTRKGGVIYLDKENGIGIMRTRTAMIKKGLETEEKYPIGFICFSQIKLDNLSDLCIMEKLIEKHKPILLIVDTYRRSVKYDENDASKVSAFFVDTMRPLVEKYDLSVILIHHNRKSSGYRTSLDEMDELRGSSDLANYADIILKMERNSGNVILKQLKNRNAQEEPPIKIDCDFDIDSEYVTLKYSGEYTKQTKSDKCVELLTIWITENKISQFKTADAKKVAFKEGIKESNFKYALDMMQNTGIIRKEGFGIYTIINS